MNNQEIEILSYTTQALVQSNYPDGYRIAKEIAEFCKFDREKIDIVLKKIATNKPWEQIRGWTEFKTLQIKVNRYTLIPRIETEQLVDIVLDSLTDEIKNIIDVGTGSGAISVYIKKVLPKLNITGVDVSVNALKIAKKNALNNEVDVKFKISDLLESVNISSPTFIIANLPYIPHSDYLLLDPSVKDFEPKGALDGGKVGLKYIRRLLKQCKGNENIKGIFLEIDPSQSQIIVNEFPEFKVTVYNDYQGLVRFLKLYL